MTPLRRITPTPPDVVKRIRQAWMEGLSIDVIRERFGLSRGRLYAAVEGLPKREQVAQTKRTQVRIPRDLT